MRKAHLVSVLVGLAVIAMLTADASATYNPRTGRFLQRDPAARPIRPADVDAGASTAAEAVAADGGGAVLASAFTPRDLDAQGLDSRPQTGVSVPSAQFTGPLNPQMRTNDVSSTAFKSKARIPAFDGIPPELSSTTYDPVTRYADSPTSYQYCASSPHHHLDPMGLEKMKICIRPVNIFPLRYSWVVVHCFIAVDNGYFNFNDKGVGPEPNPGGVGGWRSRCKELECCDVKKHIDDSKVDPNWSGDSFRFFSHNCCHWADMILRESGCPGVEKHFSGYRLPDSPIL